nr:expressed conserved protein [Hymenolepis microstoma]
MFVDFILDMMSQFKPPYNITGLLIVYPGFLLFVLEAPIKSLMVVMRGLSEPELILNQILTTGDSLKSYNIDNEEEASEAWSDDEIIRTMNSEDFVPEIYRMRMAALLNNLVDDHPEMIPNLADVWYFGEVSKNESLLSVVEYVNRNDKPYQLTDPEAYTWPLPSNAFLYG